MVKDQLHATIPKHWRSNQAHCEWLIHSTLHEWALGEFNLAPPLHVNQCVATSVFWTSWGIRSALGIVSEFLVKNWSDFDACVIKDASAFVSVSHSMQCHLVSLTVSFVWCTPILTKLTITASLVDISVGIKIRNTCVPTVWKSVENCWNSTIFCYFWRGSSGAITVRGGATWTPHVNYCGQIWQKAAK